MSTQITIVREKTFDIIKSAVNQMVDLIRPTLGPASNKVIIDRFAYRMVVDDGVQIARDFELPDPAENAVIKIIKEVLVKTNDRAGDGTTGAAIMLQAIINEVSRRNKFDGHKIEKELKLGLADVKRHLDEFAKPIKTKEEIKKVALTSFDNETIAEMLAELYFKLGKEGIITIDKSPTMKTITEMTLGTKLEHGYISPYMVNNIERMETVFEKPYILITDYRITENADIVPIMEKMAAKGIKNLVILAENVESSALATLVINEPQVMNPETHKLGTFPSVAINLPSVDDRKIFLEDMALLTGAKMYTESKGDKLSLIEIADLGRAERFICRRDESIIVGPKGKKDDIKDAIAGLRMAANLETNEKRKNDLLYRCGRFTNSIAVIRVGAATENEQKALKYKVEDVINSVKSALNKGVVCGAGRELARIKTSSPILNEALKYPARQLMENMGLSEDFYLNESHVMNVVTGDVGPFMAVGVMDPIEALIAGVESAVSIASILLTSSGIICEHASKIES